MDKPYFSLFATAIRSQYYEDAYKSASENCDVPFEIVFCGHVKPLKRMPDNFRYIYSEASPAQCWEIAARESRANYIIPVADDLRYSKNFLNKSFYYTNLFDSKKILLSFRYYIQLDSLSNGISFDESGFFDISLPQSPSIGLGGIFSKEVWINLGGIDRRFFGSFADIDIMLRCYSEIGMHNFVIPDCFMVEVPRNQKDGKSLLKRSNPRSLLNSFWVKDGVVSKYRLSPVEVFK